MATNSEFSCRLIKNVLHFFPEYIWLEKWWLQYYISTDNMVKLDTETVKTSLYQLGCCHRMWLTG